MDKLTQLEHFTVYFPKFLLAQLLLGTSFIESLDVVTRLLGTIAGIVLTVYMIWRMHKDIKIRNEELKIKRIARIKAERDLNLNK